MARAPWRPMSAGADQETSKLELFPVAPTKASAFRQNKTLILPAWQSRQDNGGQRSSLAAYRPFQAAGSTKYVRILIARRASAKPVSIPSPSAVNVQSCGVPGRSRKE